MVYQKMTKEEKLNKLFGWILQEDANCPMNMMLTDDLTIEQYLQHRFEHIYPETTSAIIWDLGLESEAYRVYLKGSLPLRDHITIQRWAKQGIDYLDVLEKETHKRGMLALWNHRLAEIDIVHPMQSFDWKQGGYNNGPNENYLKTQHPDWVNKCWWDQGLWNLANPELRAHKIKILREIVTNYPLDGIQLDFARHTPVLPPGHEWENRDAATEFVRNVRKMLDEVGETQNRPMLLTARIAENVNGNHFDGLEVERWIAEGLLDAISPGGRTAFIDFEGYRSLPGGDKIKIFPSFDVHHTAEGFHQAPSEYLRGVFGNFAAQNADGVSIFNMTEIPISKPFVEMVEHPFNKIHFAGGHKLYRAERRGEYPWAGNYLYRSDDKPLPMDCAHSAGAVIPLEIYSDTPAQKVSLMIDNMQEDDILSVQLDRVELKKIRFEETRLDSGNTYGKDVVPHHPAADYDAGNLMLCPGRHFVTVLFRANVHPVIFKIRDVAVECFAKKEIGQRK